MAQTIKTTKKTINVAKSLGFVLDKNYAEELKIKKGDLVEISLRKLRQRRLK